MKRVRSTRQKIVLPQVTQESGSHCGPATLELLFAYLNKFYTQKQIVKAAKVAAKIKANGTQPHDLARAVAVLAPDSQFWFKQHATVEDVATLVRKYHWPVAVSWQGLFFNSPEEEKPNPQEDNGHYSVVTEIDIAHDKIVIVDPYGKYSAKPRVFSLKWFVNRWWDEVININKRTGKNDSVWTEQLIFIVAPKTASFPTKVGMQLPDQLGVLKQRSALDRVRQVLRAWK